LWPFLGEITRWAARLSLRCTLREAFSYLFGGWRCVDATTWEDVTGIAQLSHAAVYICIPEATLLLPHASLTHGVSEVMLGVAAWAFYKAPPDPPSSRSPSPLPSPRGQAVLQHPPSQTPGLGALSGQGPLSRQLSRANGVPACFAYRVICAQVFLTALYAMVAVFSYDILDRIFLAGVQ
jgi:hypothetical protein